MTRVAMVAFTDYPTDARVRREAEALAARGDDVDVVCLGDKNSARDRVINGVRLHTLPVSRYRGSSARAYILSYLPFFVAASYRLARLHLQKHYQVVQVHTMPDFMVFCALIPKLSGARVILDIHDLMPELCQSRFGLQRSHWLVRFTRWLEHRSICFADRAIAVHKPHLDALVEHGNRAERFVILMNLPDPKVFSAQPRRASRSDGRFRLVYHGTVSRRHGLHVVLRSLPLIREEISGLDLRIFGEGDDMPYLIELVDSLGLKESVSIHRGLLPMQQLIPMIGDADLGIVPILYDEFTRYMLPVKLLEYVALGIPVVSSRTETIRAYLDESMVQYVNPGDPQDFADKVLDLYRNPEKRERLAEAAAQFSQEHSWEQDRQVYYDLIDELSSGRAGR